MVSCTACDNSTWTEAIVIIGAGVLLICIIIINYYNYNNYSFHCCACLFGDTRELQHAAVHLINATAEEGYNGRLQLHGDGQDSKVQGQFRRGRGDRPHGQGPGPIGPHGSRYPADRRGNKKFLSFEELKHLAHGCSEEIVRCVITDDASSMHAFTSTKNCSDHQILKYLVTIIYKLINSKEKDLASRILGQIFSGIGDYSAFNSRIESFLLKCITLGTTDDDITFLLYLVEIGMFGLDRVPNNYNTMNHSCS